MRIQHNIMAMNSYRNYNNNANALSKNLEKLSSGYKINRAGDDAAGLAISEKMRAQITGLRQAQDNAKSGINLVKTAEGALQEVHDMLNRMVKLADQSSNGIYKDGEVDRNALQDEVKALQDEIDRISKATNFNGKNLLDGTLGGGGDIKVGAASTLAVGKGLGGTQTTAPTTVISGVTGQLREGTYTLTNGTIDADGKFTAATTGTAIKVSFAKTDGSTEVSYVDLADLAATPTSESKVGTQFTVSFGDFSLQLTNTTDATMSDVVKTLNGKTVIGSTTGTATTGGLKLQIGDTAAEYNKIVVSVGDMSTNGLHINGIDISTESSAAAAIDKINEAIDIVSQQRGVLGATQNRLEHTINNLSVMTENIQDAESTIRDTDVADEMMAYTKNNILIQSAQAMLAQANQVPQGVLQLMQ